MIIPSANVIPDKGQSLIAQYLQTDVIPDNLTIRISAYFVNQIAPSGIAKRLGVVTSTVHTDGKFTCPASKQGNFCLDCRACWDRDIANVGYKAHGSMKPNKARTPEANARLKVKLDARMAVYAAKLAVLEAKIVERVAKGERPFRTKAEALLYVGGVSKPSKMPCDGFSISAEACHKGSELAKIPASICFGCYAMSGFYAMDDTLIAMFRRMTRIGAPLWVEAFVKILENVPYFRWFDSGDIQSVEMLARIAEIAKRSPHCKFWLPTKEYTVKR